MNIDWTWLLIGLVLGTFFGGALLARVTGLFTKSA